MPIPGRNSSYVNKMIEGLIYHTVLSFNIGKINKDSLLNVLKEIKVFISSINDISSDNPICKERLEVYLSDDEDIYRLLCEILCKEGNNFHAENLLVDI
jgi:hypothetical protein